jgi:trk system potassium uptake protein TrkA
VAVIGLGRFGTSLARTLHELGYDVTAIDIGERQVAEAADFVTLAAQGDGTDEEMLRSLHVERSDVGVVAQGENLEASVLTTLLLKRLGVPWVVAKAKTALHGELLARIGADRVVFPERDAGVRLAHSLAVRHINDYIPLSPTTGVAKLTAPAPFVGQTLAALCGERQTKLNVLLIKRGQTLITVPHYDERVQAGDELLVVGPDREIEAFIQEDKPAERGP